MRKNKSLAFITASFIFYSQLAWALPSGQEVVSGAVDFSWPDASTLNITASDKSIIQYDSFGIGASEAVQFIQPSVSSVVLNRVTGADPTSILGRMSANGRVFLINPNGILFGQNAVVDTASLIVSTLGISNEDFLNNRYHFTASPGSENSSIFNGGTIRAADGGWIGLLAGEVENQGVIIAREGKIFLASGAEATVDFHGDGLMNFSVSGELSKALVKNGGLIEAQGGEVLLTAKAAQNVLESVVNNEGIIRAQSLVEKEGVIRLVNMDGAVANSGALDVSSEENNGGFVETSGRQLYLTAAPNLSAPNGKSGLWFIDPYNIEIIAGSGNSNINAGTPFASSGNTAQLGVDLIVTALTSGDVSISTGAGGGQAGNLVLTANLDFNGIGTNKTLTLNAHNDLTLNGTISQTGTDDSLNLIFNANSDNSGGGAIIANNSIATGGGSVTFQDGVYLRGDVNTSTSETGRAGGAVTFQGQTILATGTSIAITTTGQGASGDGAVSFQSLLDSGNSYAYVSDTTRTWLAAKTNAASGTGSGVGDTYLATATSSLENSVITSTSANNQAWIGGSDATTEGDWRWVTGPEGLENSGVGRPFWSGASGGSAVNGSYTNWNSGEPNDSGGNEDALQLGFGTAGQWNDLPTGSTALNYIRETNLATTDLSITAGTATVSFSDAVGSNKSLGDLTIVSAGTVSYAGAVTAETVAITNSGVLSTAAAADMTLAGTFTHSGTGSASLAGDITTVGNINFNRAVAVNTDVTFYATGTTADVNVAGTFTKSAGTDATLTFRADDGIFFTGGVDITGSSNKLNIILNSDRDASGAGNINTSTGSVFTSNGGQIVLSGGAGTTTDLKTTGFAYGTSAGGTNNRGVYLTGTTLSSGAGDITIRGTGASINAVTNQGVDIVTNSVIQSTSGNITGVGIAGNGSAQDNQQGFVLYNGSSIITDAGAITLTGTAGAGTGNSQVGIGITTNAVIRMTGAGTLAMTGTGGSSGASSNNYGINIEGTSIIEGVASGGISMTGTEGAGSVAIRLADSSTVGEGATAGTYSGDVSLTANKMNLSAGTIQTTGTVTLQNRTAGTLINLGSTTDAAVGTLELSDTELSNVTAGTLTAGRSTAGSVTVSQQVSPAGAGTFNVTTGGAINGTSDDSTADIIAAILNLTAASGGIGTSTKVDITVSSAFHADTSADNGNILVDAIGDLPVGYINAGTGTVTLIATGAMDDDAVDKILDFTASQINLTAPNGISLIRELELPSSGVVHVTDNLITGTQVCCVELQVDGSIYDDEDQKANDVCATDSMKITAGGVVGTPENALEVIIGGRLDMVISGEQDGISAVINGTTSDGLLHLLNQPKGLVVFNHDIVAGEDFQFINNQIGQSLSPESKAGESIVITNDLSIAVSENPIDESWLLKPA